MGIPQLTSLQLLPSYTTQVPAMESGVPPYHMHILGIAASFILSQIRNLPFGALQNVN
jgi:hypothetical protein